MDKKTNNFPQKFLKVKAKIKKFDIKKLSKKDFIKIFVAILLIVLITLQFYVLIERIKSQNGLTKVFGYKYILVDQDDGNFQKGDLLKLQSLRFEKYFTGDLVVVKNQNSFQSGKIKKIYRKGDKDKVVIENKCGNSVCIRNTDFQNVEGKYFSKNNEVGNLFLAVKKLRFVILVFASIAFVATFISAILPANKSLLFFTKRKKNNILSK